MKPWKTELEHLSESIGENFSRRLSISTPLITSLIPLSMLMRETAQGYNSLKDTSFNKAR